MFLMFLIIGCIVLSVTMNTFIKGVVYNNINFDERDEDNEPSNGILLTAFGVVLISNLIPFTLGAIVGLYAIL